MKRKPSKMELQSRLRATHEWKTIVEWHFQEMKTHLSFGRLLKADEHWAKAKEIGMLANNTLAWCNGMMEERNRKDD
jgi:hypothetical protein